MSNVYCGKAIIIKAPTGSKITRGIIYKFGDVGEILA